MTRTYDPGDQDQVAKRQETAALAKQQANADWQFVLGCPQGRRVMAGILTRSGFLDASYRHADALGTAHAEGARSIGLQIYSAATSAGQAGLAEALLAEVIGKPHV